MNRNARYRGIPCWYDPITDAITGKNKFYDFLISVMIWIDFNVFLEEELPIWVEVDDLEK